MGTHICRRLGCGLVVALIAFACYSPSARAAWNSDPVTVTSTTVSIPLVEGCADGAYGTFVAWQEKSSPGQGVLRAQHLLPTGDHDPAWPAAGAVACSVLAARSELVALPDRLGGLYLLWKESATLSATRLDPSGAVAAGWPTGGRRLGAVFYGSPRVSVIEDGAHGFYAAWANSLGLVVAIHLGPGNTGAGGWPNGTRGIGPASVPYDTLYWPQIALAPDGGVFVAWASASADTGASPSAWRLRRLSSAGLSAIGWTDQGLLFGSFHRELLGAQTEGSLLALSPDARGGVFLMIGNPVGTDPPDNWAALETRLHRLQGGGGTAPDWPAEGRVVQSAPYAYWDRVGWLPDASYRVLADGRDGALVGVPVYYDHITNIGFLGFTSAGQSDMWWAVQDLIEGYEAAAKGDGGLFLASFYPTGAYSGYQPNAFLRVTQSLAPPGWSDWFEYHPEPVIQWYGDIGLAPTEDGGAVFFWSQVRERIGLFARRFSPAGEVTAVESGQSGTFTLSGLRFVPGAGVRVSVTLPGPGSARFELFDLAGRRVAFQAIEAHPQQLTLAGTAALPSGLYFGRLVAGAHAVAGKVIVAH